jgi:hypothetical protein
MDLYLSGKTALVTGPRKSGLGLEFDPEVLKRYGKTG